MAFKCVSLRNPLVQLIMPSICLVQKLENIVEDVKIINEFYIENGAEGIIEMIQPIKFLIGIISDILNHQIWKENNGSNFYRHYRNYQEIKGEINKNWDNFDKGLIWIIQRLNFKDFSTILIR